MLLVEFYFSDSNLPFDKFLWTLTLKNPDGYVPLSTVASFKRMRDHTTAYGIPFIVEAVKELAQEIELDETQAMVRRKRALEKDHTAWERTVYVKGFGAGETSHNSQEQVEEWFKQFGQVNAVRFRREDDGKGRKNRGAFKGSVFAEFKTLNDAKAFIEREPKPTFQDEPVVAMSKEAYVQMKVKEKGLDAGSIVRDPKKDKSSSSDAPGRKFNAFNEMAKIKASGGKLPVYLQKAGVDGVPGLPGAAGKRKREDGGDDEQAFEKKAKAPEGPLKITFNGAEIEVDRSTGAPLDKSTLTFPERAVLKFTNCGPDGDWKQLKQEITDAGVTNTFMNFPRGQTWGFLALNEAISDETVDLLRAKSFVVGGQTIAWERVTGDEERDFYAMRAGFQGKLAIKKIEEQEAQRREQEQEAQKRGHHQQGGRGGRGNGRGGRGGRGGNGRGGRGGRGNGRGGRGGGAQDGGDRQPKSSGGPMDTDVSGTMSKSSGPPTIG